VRKCRTTLREDLLAVSDKQQPCTWEFGAKPCIIHGRHDGLAGARRGHEKVTMVTLLTRQFDLLEQPLLERLQTDLDGT
jgi:hypothetical protein